MTSKERMTAAITHKEADRVPRGENQFDSSFFKEVVGRDTLCYGGWRELETLWAGGREQIVQDYIDSLVAIAETLGWDYVRLPLAPKKRDYSGFKRIGETSYQDDLGRKFSFNPVVGHVSVREDYDTEMEIDELEEIDAPFEVDDSELDIIRGVADRIGESHFLVGRCSIGGTFSWTESVGLAEFLVRMITDPDFVHKATARQCAKTMKYAEAMIGAGCDAFFVSEDYADTRGLMMGKARYEEFIMPYLKKICDKVHGLGAFFIKHTDGVMWDALDSFVEMGIDAWHGIQPSLGMDIKKLKEKYGGKLCLFGGVNVETLIEGTDEEIQGEVRHAIQYGAKGGGLVITCGNIVEPGTPASHYYSVMEACKKWGDYPISI